MEVPGKAMPIIQVRAINLVILLAWSASLNIGVSVSSCYRH